MVNGETLGTQNASISVGEINAIKCRIDVASNRSTSSSVELVLHEASLQGFSVP